MGARESLESWVQGERRHLFHAFPDVLHRHKNDLTKTILRIGGAHDLGLELRRVEVERIV